LFSTNPSANSSCGISVHKGLTTAQVQGKFERTAASRDREEDLATPKMLPKISGFGLLPQSSFQTFCRVVLFLSARPHVLTHNPPLSQDLKTDYYTLPLQDISRIVINQSFEFIHSIIVLVF
jgi:hypothetical protein